MARRTVKTGTGNTRSDRATAKAYNELAAELDTVKANFDALNAKFHDLLVKLDADTGLDESDYHGTLVPTVTTPAEAPLLAGNGI